MDGGARIGAADPASDVRSASLFISAFASGVADATANEDDVGRAMAEEGPPIGTGRRDATIDGEPSPAALFASSWFRSSWFVRSWFVRSCPTLFGPTDVIGGACAPSANLLCINGISAWAFAVARGSAAEA
jgi:hypothetical protein